MVAWKIEHRNYTCNACLAKLDKQPQKLKQKAERMSRYQKDPRLRQRHEARWKLRRKVVSGKIKRQPCSQCGTPKAQAHHEDYSKPYDVQWLCVPCHRKVHALADAAQPKEERRP